MRGPVRAAGATTRPIWTLAALWILVTVVTLVIGPMGGPSLERAISTMLVYLVAVVGLYSFVGNSGVFSFGHVGFIAIGAYSTAAFRIPAATKAALFPGLPDVTLGMVPATIAGGAIAMLAGAVIALVVCRFEGLAAALATFAFLSIIFMVASNLKSVTGGQTGLFGIPLTTTPESALPWALGAIAVVWAFGESRLCLRLRATREDEVAARSIGIGVVRERVVAFTISAFFCGVAGGLMAQYLGTFNSQAFYLDLTLLTIAMLVVGGARSLSGAVVGTIFLSLVREWLRTMEGGFAIGPVSVSAHPGLQNFGMAVALLLVLLFIPSGLTRGKELGDLLAAPVRSIRSRRIQPVVELTDEEGGTR
ncbi:branched-chain amino acid ABC transporter permease [Planotetraspora sp. GP83]|uniref:branched-chain amino acid ABC transporter permease n=1 Tax=Planotetraspora sp. GP83 TaxID=3156264 RepID=UPI003512C1C0